MECEPPPPPAVRRMPRLPLWRWIGLVAVAIPPVLATAGLLGAERGVASAAAGPLAVEVRWPRTAHFQDEEDLEVTVHNRGDTPVTARVSLDPEWVGTFEGARFSPEPDALWRFELPLGPGERGRVEGRVEADRAGPHAGTVGVTAAGVEVVVPVDTFVWP